MPTDFFSKYDFQPDKTLEVVSGDPHTVPASAPYDIYLRHIPREQSPSTVSILGFAEVGSTPGPGEFTVHYGVNGTGRVQFNSADAGAQVEVGYNACGTILWADAINTMQGAINGAEILIDNMFGRITTLETQVAANRTDIDKLFERLVREGIIVAFQGAVADIWEGWALCDGQNGTPDLRDRFIVGAEGAYAVGDTGGEAQHTLTVAEMPSHDHGGQTGESPHAGGEGQAGASNEEGFAKRDQPHSHSIPAQGGDQPHENRPPYYALCWIMQLAA